MAEETWRELSDVIESAERDVLEQFLDDLTPDARTLAVSRLSDATRERLLETVDPEDAAEILEGLPESQVTDAFENMSAELAARIVEEMPSHHAADVVGELSDEAAEAIFSEMSPADAIDIRALSRYEDDEGGGLMVSEKLSYDSTTAVGDVVADLQGNADRYEDFDVQYVYVTDSAGRLEGVLYLRSLLLTPPWKPISEIMLPEPRYATDKSTVEELHALFDTISFNAVPVVDEHRHLLGVLRRSAVEERMAERSDRDYRLTQGIVGGEELRTMPLMLRARRRLSWLSVNVVLNVIAASVIAANEETLSQVIALAVFLPILSDMSGCSGNQAVAVTMRELSLGVVRPNEILRTALKEISVGAINGLCLGILVGCAAWAYSGTPWLGVVIGVALMLNTMLAVIIGGCVPLGLKRFGVDPALASGPLLTTVTDMCGFFLVLTFAGAVIDKLV
ncbi:Magnesium transporter MgtE [Planctomycetes bacterium Poly30]|uniref:Magnesium transporter MgtE n=1 Tax=Saltatorellus ferox TaxID=2528018 RepID=A0A518EPE4_9BACT|nr:Magnesium transporter MgtE [Planctomycetes bacterium Poly30]